MKPPIVTEAATGSPNFVKISKNISIMFYSIIKDFILNDPSIFFSNSEIKEHRIQADIKSCLKGKRTAERQYSEGVRYQCIKSKAELEEKLNGRLAMLGFIIAVGTYITTGQIIPGIF